ncbi:Inner membrane transport protein YhjV [Caballeronia calidae]|uniref:Inner membrane transport protein YhjV n=1 Tax=Caballeronia calidae TaxID=1777139 RepID=A0A158E7U4_9BURK|nr:amino acid permease [Caballeronia calidae]SAL02945.1 Inner membrane transport protein YhjV [Caballeronia calidae]
MKTTTGAFLNANDNVNSYPKLGAYDVGWIVLCIGMAIGSGIIFLPIQMGVKGFWVSITSLMIAYPAVYCMSKVYLQSLSATESCDDYANIVTQYLGKNWGAALGVAYFIMLLKGMLAYASAITKDSASYLQTYGVTHHSLGSSVWYISLLIGAMVLIASRGERLLFRISGPLIVVKLSIVVFLGVSMIPYWDIRHLGIINFPNALSFLRDLLLTLPFSMFSILFVQILNPMNVAFRKRESDRRIATFRALRASRYAYTVLVVCVIFFGFSFLLSITPAEARYALDNNISALALAAKVMSGDVVRILSTLLNVVAIFTAFFGIYLGFHDALKGIVVNAIDRVIVRSETFNKILPLCIAAGTIGLLVAWVVFGISAMSLMQITVPVFGVVSCLIPCCLIWRVPALKQLRTPSSVLVFLFGLLLVASPFFKLLEH